jgi:hypothetical protein
LTDRLGVVISNEDTPQLYMEQIYASNCFDKKEMVDQENKPIHIKDDYNKAKLYLKGLVRDFKAYTQNSGGNSKKRAMRVPTKWLMLATRSGSTSRRLPAQQLPPMKKNTEWATNISKETKTNKSQLEAMTAQIKLQRPCLRL